MSRRESGPAQTGSLGEGDVHMHVHIPSLVVMYESKHKRGLTPLLGQEQTKVLLFV